MTEWANLTNGLLCAPTGAPVLRLGSTKCEQRLWDDVLAAIPDEMLYRLALGEPQVVHDQSERLRWTRAQWQGLAFVRTAARLVWKLPPVQERGGRSIYSNTAPWPELDHAARHICSRERSRLRYYRRYLTVEHVDLWSCDCERVRASQD